MVSFLSSVDSHFRWIASYFFKKHVFGLEHPSTDKLETLRITPHFLFINKDCDIAVNTNNPEEHPVTVATQLKYNYPHLVDPRLMHGFRFCHRLDYSTSGVLCVALTREAARCFSNALNSYRTEKYYLALLHGHVSDNYVVINKAIGVDTRHGFTHRMCTDDKEYCDNPRWASSMLLVLQRGLYNNYPATKVLLKLLTGRRHQLRVHCHDLGHTIIGDYTYSNRKDLTPYRMFLHAFRFVLPMNDEVFDVRASDPFTEFDARNKWLPVEIVNPLDENVFCKFRTDM